MCNEEKQCPECGDELEYVVEDGEEATASHNSELEMTEVDVYSKCDQWYSCTSCSYVEDISSSRTLIDSYSEAW